MFRRKQTDIEKLAEKYGELKKKAEDLEQENGELKQIRLQEVRNNTKILKQSNKKDELIKNIEKSLEINKYGNERIALNKIKELISDYQSQN